MPAPLHLAARRGVEASAWGLSPGGMYTTRPKRADGYESTILRYRWTKKGRYVFDLSLNPFFGLTQTQLLIPQTLQDIFDTNFDLPISLFFTMTLESSLVYIPCQAVEATKERGGG
jgi:hypothetical protein